MTLAQYLTLRLRDDAAVAAIVGADGVHSEVLPQNPNVPAIVFTLTGGETEHLLDGQASGRMAHLDVYSWTETRPETTTLSLAVRAVLCAHHGAAAGLTVDGILQSGQPQWGFDDESDLYWCLDSFDVMFSGVES